MKLNQSFLKGSYTPVVTTFRDGQLDLDQYARLLERQEEEGSHGVVICGTTGEPSSLTVQERNRLLELAIKTLGGKIPVVAATGSQSLEETLELSQKAEKLGADALLIVTPYYIKPPQEGLFRYFVKASSMTGLPWMIYHIPGRAGVSITVETVSRIAEKSPNLVGLKHASNDLEFVTELLVERGPDFRIFCGLESLSFPMLAIGGAGLMNAVGNLVPSQVAALCKAVTDNDPLSARELHFQLFELNKAIFLSTNPIPIKYMMSRLGLLHSPEVRLPLAPLNRHQEKILDRVLESSGLLEKAVSD